MPFKPAHLPVDSSVFTSIDCTTSARILRPRRCPHNLRIAGSTTIEVITLSWRVPALPRRAQCSPPSVEPKTWPSLVPRKIRFGLEGSLASVRTSPPGGPIGRHSCASNSNCQRGSEKRHNCDARHLLHRVAVILNQIERSRYHPSIPNAPYEDTSTQNESGPGACHRTGPG